MTKNMTSINLHIGINAKYEFPKIVIFRNRKYERITEKITKAINSEKNYTGPALKLFVCIINTVVKERVKDIFLEETGKYFHVIGYVSILKVSEERFRKSLLL